MTDQNSFDFKNTPASEKRPKFNYQLKNRNSSPIVTIVTPFYNTTEVFYETAKSIYNQSFQQWEWLIINDCSNDEVSLKILDEYRDIDPRIKVIDHPKNMGLSASRNSGFKNAKSDYIVFIDSDDLIEPTTIEKWFWFLFTKKEFAFVKGYTVGFGAQEYLWTKGFNESEKFLEENLVTATSMVRREVFDKTGGFDEKRKGGFEDWDFWLNCADKGLWGGVIPEFMDWYRRRDTHSDRWESWSQKGIESFKNEAKKKYPKIFKEGSFPHPKEEIKENNISFEYPKINILKKEKKRVLMIVPWLEMGGADNFNLNFLSQITKRGWEVTIVTTYIAKNRWANEFLKYSDDIFFLHNFLNKYDYPSFLLYLINSRDFDVVMISNSELGYKILPLLKAFYPNCSYIDYNHMEQEEWLDGGYPKIGVDYQNFLDLNGVTSDHLKNWMIKRGADLNRIKRCYINVDTDIWKPDKKIKQKIKKEYGIDEKTPIIFYAARICPQKKPQVFIKTIKKLKDKGLKFLAIVAGDGEDFEWLKNYVLDYKLQDVVKLLGAIPNNKVNRLMKAADIFFLSSQWEGIALSIYEAMACGVTVVGSDVGGQKELVTKECGFLIKPKDDKQEIEEYSKILQNLIENPSVLHEMEKNARIRIEKYFRLDQMGDCMEQMLKKAIILHQEDKREVPSKQMAMILVKEVIKEIYIGQSGEDSSAKKEQKFPLVRKIINSNKLTRKVFEGMKPFLKKMNQNNVQKENKDMQKLKEWIKELEEAKKWLEEQNRNKDKYILELKDWIKKIEDGKKWLEEENQRLNEKLKEYKK